MEKSCHSMIHIGFTHTAEPTFLLNWWKPLLCLGCISVWAYSDVRLPTPDPYESILSGNFTSLDQGIYFVLSNYSLIPTYLLYPALPPWVSLCGSSWPCRLYSFCFWMLSWLLLHIGVLLVVFDSAVGSEEERGGELVLNKWRMKKMRKVEAGGSGKQRCPREGCCGE